MLIVLGLLLILVVTLATGFFVAQEFAYVAVDRERLRVLADAGDRPAERALRVTDRLSFTLSGSQLGITVTGLLAGYVAEPFIGQGLAEVLGVAGVPTAVSLTAAVAVAVVAATVIQMVLGELAPKNLAIARPEALARALAGPTLVYLAVAGWLIRIFDTASDRLLRLVGIESIEHLPQGATPEDLEGIIARSHSDGLLDTDTYRLLDRGLGFRFLTAAEAMVPRVAVVTMAADAPAARVVEAMDTGHTRFPVIGESIDDVIGVVSIGDVADLAPRTRTSIPVRELCTPAVLVTSMAPLPRVLDRLRCERQQLACVMDEYGGLAGIITLEDIAEELVGDIRDEDDLPEPTLTARPDGSWQIPGRWRLDEIADATGVVLPDDIAYDTISGLIMARLGRVPAVGDEVTVTLVTVPGDDGEPGPTRRAVLQVLEVARHVPVTVMLGLRDDQVRPGAVPQPEDTPRVATDTEAGS
jgi:CBS domain containing-hemolysin-like protein